MDILKYRQNPIVTSLLKELPKEATESIPTFLNHPKTTWEKMKKLDDVLKKNNLDTEALFERIIHREFLREYFNNHELSLYYRGFIHSRIAVGTGRELHLGLTKENIHHLPEHVLYLLHSLHRWCSEEIPFEDIKRKVFIAFSKTRNVEEFLAELESFMLKKEGGFNGRARYQTVVFIAGNLRDVSSKLTLRQLAIRTMGSAIQLHWCSVMYTHSDFNTFLDFLEQSFEEIRTLPVANNSELRSLLLNKLNKFFAEEFPPL